jgi:excisionase family DNA binding protein
MVPTEANGVKPCKEWFYTILGKVRPLVWKAGSVEGSFTVDNSKSRLMTAKDAASYLGISLSTLNRIEKEARLLPFRTPGGHRRYDRAMLDEYLESTRVLPVEKVEVVVRNE